ncbi:2-polyprenyl-6-methoxyphenol hydroxylase-like oxidoreductase [Burkholderia sp. Ch1-1]|uniref:2-polyprenyl-6-methoxyphenol hydroxylase-like oxidoreductase n=1 Tax=Paraburkholderia dioscoreae TaxID=2604047 RepID=A0A5Q4Z3E5_9BURK|nr:MULTISPECIES: NAD(P)/FAD-dependent oxidoreductase [Paraburkholderia]EIF34338.1 2-polyprenyl-6-methoxyphenol hydroxylase-like oxidoreductase [Burkholderia sp. Ch1-1]MDR8395205.1 FAD-dependent monooxygenase [Paraburkholderia sp. USG1]VVD33274.1 2-polyprenyl-6-methoxyphenol hydroxylase-like oxidoreductase [Paraburkholderia dioscoreae]
MTQRTVEIIGAGLAGLVAANRFAQLGWKVRIHERNAELRMFGAGIWLWESGLKTLETICAYAQAVERARVIREWQIRDHRGSVLMSRLAHAGDRLMLPPRADLYQALIDRAVAQRVEIFTSSLAVAVAPDGTTTFESGATSHADLVIVADGAYSRIRESILGTKWIDFGSEVGIRMLIDEEPGDIRDTLIEYWNGPWRLLYNPCTDGRNYIFLSAPVGDERARKLPIDVALWTEKFPHAADLIRRFQVDSRWDRLVNVKCRKWSEGRVAIVGDAAHAMPPNLGQAANTAFINVMALAELASGPAGEHDLPATLRAWETQQRSITDHVQWWSYLYGYVLGKWPASLLSLRSDVVRAIAKTEWFDESLNRGARHVPAGFERAAPLPMSLS